MGESIDRIERGNQKLKTLYLMKILLEETDADERHALTVKEMLSRLESMGIIAERKSIYKDLDILTDYGLDIEKFQADKTTYYHVVTREFETAELKLLVDAVQSARFMTEKRSRELIEKLTGFCSTYQAGELRRHVYVSGKAKTENTAFFYSLDTIHAAIAVGSRINFRYFNWNERKEKVFRHDGAIYDVSPWELMQDDENYYLIAFDEKDQKIKHYRVDKMADVKRIPARRNGEKAFKAVHVADYASMVFGMYGGREDIVTLLCRKDMAGVIIDRFGKDVTLIPKDQEHFEAKVKVNVSNQFLAWVISLGEGVQITGPGPVLDQVKEMVARLNRQYPKE